MKGTTERQIDVLAQSLGLVTLSMLDGTTYGRLQRVLTDLRQVVNEIIRDEETDPQLPVRRTQLLPQEFFDVDAEAAEHAHLLRSQAGQNPCPTCHGEGWV